MANESISRREFLGQRVFAGTALSLAVSGQMTGEEASERMRRPNILLIFSDQQHWQAMGCVDPFFETPNQDMLAKESMVFERAFCTTPQCSPSRSSLLTGFYPSTTTIMGNVGAAGGNRLGMPTVGKELHDAGYTTGYFGKWHLGGEAVAKAGWDHSNFRTHDATAEKGAVGFLQNRGTSAKPFALFVSFNNPHDIYRFKKYRSEHGEVPIPLSWERETFEGKPPIQKQFMEEDQGTKIHGQPLAEWQKYRDCYRAKTKLYDSNVGVILEELKRQGQWGNTIIILTSDHGDMDAQHRLIFKGPFMYEHMVRIPLMICVPKKYAGVGPRRVTDIDVVNVDIVPTIREFCGLPEAASHGMSLVPVLTGSKGYRPREFVISQYYSKQRWVNPIRMIRTGDFKLNRHIRWGDELYDLKDDPHELRNLADDGQYAAIKHDLAQKLDQWIADHEDPFDSLHATSRKGKMLG